MPLYETALDKVLTTMEPLIDRKPIDSISSKMGLKTAKEVGKTMIKARHDIADHFSLITAPASTILDKWFDNDMLKGMLATDAVIGSF